MPGFGTLGMHTYMHTAYIIYTHILHTYNIHTGLKSEHICASVLADMYDVPGPLTARWILTSRDGKTCVANAEASFPCLQEMLFCRNIDTDHQFYSG